MFCPLCYAEYREGFTRCSDCDVDLVDSLPAASAAEFADGPKLVHLWIGVDPVFSSSLTAALTSAGIPFFENPPRDHYNWLLERARSGAVAAVPNFDIQVPETQFAAATEILKAIPEQVTVDQKDFPVVDASAEADEDDTEPPLPPTTLAEFLAWSLPMLGYYILWVWRVLEPQVEYDQWFRPASSIAELFAWVGFFWMFYQAARYERRPAKYIALAFVPFSFTWYWVRRYSWRRGKYSLPAVKR